MIRFITPFLLFILFTAFPIKAEDKKQCQKSDINKELAYFKRLSLDIRGALPSLKEYQDLVKAKKFDLKVLDKWLEGPDFQKVIDNFHRDLLWANISNIKLAVNSWRLNGNGVSVPFYASAQARKRTYRGGNVYCLNEKAQILGNGEIKTKCKNEKDSTGKMVKICQEGYVEVEPYWAPGTKVKVCAFDAQDTITYVETYKNNKGKDARRTNDCRTQARGQKCGCGKNMTYCQTKDITRQILNSFQEQSLRYISKIISAKKPYTDIFSTANIEINGPISHFLKFLVSKGGNQTLSFKENYYQVQTIPYTQIQKWTETKTTKLHAGVLTLPLFLLKFGTARSRANRFYNTFLCKHFQAPPGGIPPAQDSCHDEPNLMKRCGCKFCHKSVEPTASYWGRWVEPGLSPLNFDEFPDYSTKCAYPKNKNNYMCRLFYFTKANHDDEKQYIGKLKSLVFANDDMLKNIEKGPAELAKAAIDSGQFARCTTIKLWKFFMGKEPQDMEAERINQIAENFKKSSYRFDTLVKEILSSPEYKENLK